MALGENFYKNRMDRGLRADLLRLWRFPDNRSQNGKTEFPIIKVTVAESIRVIHCLLLSRKVQLPFLGSQKPLSRRVIHDLIR